MSQYTKKGSFSILFALFIAMTFGSCVNEDIEDCKGVVSIGFDYSYNMLSANAFDGQVDQVALYVFNREGVLVMKEAGGETDLTNEYRIETRELTPGNYTFVAWAQSNGHQDKDAFFTIPDLTVGTSILTDLSYYLKRNSGVQQSELNNLLIGAIRAEITDGPQTQEIKVGLKKVNKKIRVVLLPYRGGSKLDVADYTFSIVDEIGNGHLSYDYSLLEDEQITYRPYYAANIVPKHSEVLNPEEIDRAAVVEINTSRLWEENNPRLIIASKTNDKEIVSVSLPWFFSLAEMEGHKKWSLQEYLDRQDEYVITLFLQDGGTWAQTIIIINGWVINNIPIGM